MSPLGGWDGRPIIGTAGAGPGSRPPSNGVASARRSRSGSPEIEQRLEREARLEAQMESMDPHSPRHRQAERVLVAARKKRKRLEREAKKR
jgi:hypothetical protein